jgi:adenylate cyclase
VPNSVQARSTVRGVIAIQVLANGLGVVVVAMYFQFLFPHAAQDELNRLTLNMTAFGIYLAANVLLLLPLNALLLRRAVVWVRNGTAPTERQRRFLFSLPGFETLTALAVWFGAAVLFGVINQDVQRVSVGIALAGVVTCTMLYLLMEGHFRPLFALALADAELPADRRDVLPRLLLAWLLGSAVPLVAIGLSPLISPGPIDANRLAWLALVGAAAGGVVMAIAAISVSRPLNRVRAALRQIEQGDLDVHVPVDDLGELGRLAEGVNDLVAGIREREALRDLFGRQVGQAGLVDLALSDDEPTSSGDRREVTVLFVDLQGYTRFAERHRPEAVVAMLNQFFRVVVAVVNREGGWVNKFEGDAALCLFGAPQDEPDHAARALRAAEAIPRELAQTDALLSAGIGLATGEVLAGFVGTPERFEYTVIGDVVNVASRLCDLAKTERTPALASVATVDAAGRPEEWQPAGRMAIRGRREKAEVYAPVPSLRRSRWYGTPWSTRAPRSAP